MKYRTVAKIPYESGVVTIKSEVFKDKSYGLQALGTVDQVIAELGPSNCSLEFQQKFKGGKWRPV